MSQDYTDTGRDAFLTWAEGELRRKTFGHRIYIRAEEKAGKRATSGRF